MKELVNTIERLWCESMHTKVMWPIHGKYRCSTCFREYEVAFQDADTHTRGDIVGFSPRLRASASR